MLARDPAKQWEWHEAYRDLAKNMYRTTYSDMIHGRETYVRSDYPAGYGGHDPAIRFDVLHRNTAIDRKLALDRRDPSRDSHPSFNLQLEGLPSVTAFPCGAKKNPTKGVVPHSGTTTEPKAPWGVLRSKHEPLNQRTIPATLRRNVSAPSLVSAGANMYSSPKAMQSTGLPPESPTVTKFKRTVNNANTESRLLRMPTEVEVLAEAGEHGF
mmetsp:Transcript_53371/g.155279  ORF Transcript_53371/g.155279 Transcript_53371/m.155279 type:complete len:212 (+) Transcript_53371:79-714(+)